MTKRGFTRHHRKINMCTTRCLMIMVMSSFHCRSCPDDITESSGQEVLLYMKPLVIISVESSPRFRACWFHFWCVFLLVSSDKTAVRAHCINSNRSFHLSRLSYFTRLFLISTCISYFLTSLQSSIYSRVFCK